MKAGNFNIKDYLEKLYEETTPMMSGGEGLSNEDGIVIPDMNKKSYDWLKREYQKGQTEVKVEISMGGAKFEPGYDLQTDLKSVKDFKPGMFGEVKTAENPNPKEQGSMDGEKKPSLDAKKEQGSFQKGEGDSEKKELPKKEEPKTNLQKGDIKNKEEKEEGEEKEEDKEKPEVKKIDLKTKKK